MTRISLSNRLESLADVVAGWASSVPPAAVTEWVAGQLRALARDVEAGGVEAEPDPGLVGIDPDPPIESENP